MPTEPLPAPPSSPALRALLATRPAILGVTLVACLIGLAGAAGSGVPLQPLTAVITVLLALCAHAGGHIIHDAHDAHSGAGTANAPRHHPFTDGSRFIQNGRLSDTQTARLGYGLVLAVIPAGLWLSWLSGPGLIGIGLAGLLVGWAYSAPPLKRLCRGPGELAIVAAWWLVVVGTDYVQRGSFSPVPMLAGLPYALLVAAILYINQFRDHDDDAARGKRTLVVMLGRDTAKWGYLMLTLAAYIALVFMIERNALPQKAAAAAFTLVLSFRAARDLIAHASEPPALAGAIRLTHIAVHAHGLLLAAALAFATWPGAPR